MITENTKAILLLTSFFNSKETKEFKPLSVNEYGYFACWLNQNGYKPESLLDPNNLTDIWMKWELPLSHTKAKSMVNFSNLDTTIDAISDTRVNELLNRGFSLSISLENWQSLGGWVMDRSHPNYPKVFRGQLKHQSPAILFGIGNQELLQNASIGFVGSRDCDAKDNQATKAYVDAISQLGYQVVSGGAKGVDSDAMEHALKRGNNAIGVLADSLLKSSTTRQWRQYLKSNQLVLISPFYPGSRFTPANAMARNKFIYLLSQATIVVTSAEKGGTWSGAKENLQKAWVPLLVSSHKSPLQKGNNGLLTGQGLPKGYQLGIKVTPDMPTEQLLRHIKQALKPQASQSELGSTALAKASNKSESQQSMFEQDLFAQPELSAESEQESQTSRLSFKEQAMLKMEQASDAADKASNTEPASQVEPHKLLKAETNEVVGGHKSNSDSPAPSGEPEKSPSEDALEKIDVAAHKTDGQEPTPTLEHKPLQEQQTETPLLDYFYAQLVKKIQQATDQILDYQAIANAYPEFSIMGKKALENWLNHLIKQNKLIRPSTAKRYQLPKV
ncbi:DNA-processing protein DprA [Paraferrimonas sp. SM1919]|uniref:DNA-processing protein DprA n=1 Tax=Paraferrimonas sp. SM1919 TaxID=2662263 RepID=UPI0013D6C098|nr:DNA-processing protein DprA [Paraferrimonas sp. SM1919]